MSFAATALRCTNDTGIPLSGVAPANGLDTAALLKQYLHRKAGFRQQQPSLLRQQLVTGSSRSVASRTGYVRHFAQGMVANTGVTQQAVC